MTTSQGRDRLRELLVAGADMVRVNAAHGTPDERAKLIEDVRTVSRELGRQVPVLFDLRGLKIRTGPLTNDEKIPICRRREKYRPRRRPGTMSAIQLTHAGPPTA